MVEHNVWRNHNIIIADKVIIIGCVNHWLAKQIQQIMFFIRGRNWKMLQLLQLHLSDQEINCIFRCVIYERFHGILSECTDFVFDIYIRATFYNLSH